MKKIVVLSISKQEGRCVYELEKTGNVLEAVANFVKDLGLAETNYNTLKDLFYSQAYLEGKTDKKYEDLENYTDFFFDIKNEEYNLNLFIGLKKVIIVVSYKTDRQKEVTESLFKFANLKEDVE